MENTIEEDIKILERIDVKYFMSAKIEQSDYIIDKADEVNNAIEHILSNYKRLLKENERYQKSDYETICLENKELKEINERLESENQEFLYKYGNVLKENEELKQDRNNNYQMIALAQNEALGYMQGYEDGKKLKKSAVANIVENQQYYIIKKQIEKYKTYIEQLRKELGQKDKIIDLMAEDIDGFQMECNRYFKDKEEVKQYFENELNK